MSPIERAARAICSLEGSGGFCACIGGDLGCKNGRGEQRYADGCVASVEQLMLSGNMDRARAALGAIEPNASMIAAAVEAAERIGPHDHVGIFRAMIDAALEER